MVLKYVAIFTIQIFVYSGSYSSFILRASYINTLHAGLILMLASKESTNKSIILWRWSISSSSRIGSKRLKVEKMEEYNICLECQWILSMQKTPREPVSSSDKLRIRERREEERRGEHGKRDFQTWAFFLLIGIFFTYKPRISLPNCVR